MAQSPLPNSCADRSPSPLVSNARNFFRKSWGNGRRMAVTVARFKEDFSVEPVTGLWHGFSGPEKGVITKGVFSLEKSLQSLKSLDSLESLENGRNLLSFPQSETSLETLESLNSLESLENGLF